jgi:tRNA-splicing endonuclease subunit Sen2
MTSLQPVADTGQTPTPSATPQKRAPKPRRPNYNFIHRNLLPIDIHPLPVLIPHNPLSLLAIFLSYLAQLASNPQQEIYNGYFSSATSSIHITDPKTVRKLWEMGFFGRGSLSRSEPTWLETQRKRGKTAEENTGQRREERQKTKLERARKELEEVERKRREEQQANVDGEMNGHIEGQPEADKENLDPDVEQKVQSNNEAKVLDHGDAHISQPDIPTGKDSPDLSNGHPVMIIANGDLLRTNDAELADIASVLESGSQASTPQASDEHTNGHVHGFEEWRNSTAPNGIPTPPPTTASGDSFQIDPKLPKLTRTKSVRFSPTIEAREFDLSAPVISPLKCPGSSKMSPIVPKESEETTALDNQEHLQLSLEEAFFLSYSLGVLKIFIDDTDIILANTSLLSLFRRQSYFPPRSLSSPSESDDPFMVSYAVYHHYRSLGWVVRSGVKFGVDYLLYNRGPAFSHAEFALVILPSYTHAYWSESEESRQHVAKKSDKSWWWLHNVNRVQAQVKKSLVLCYVDVPPPSKDQDDLAKLFKGYKIRDISVKRWTPNRMRD